MDPKEGVGAWLYFGQQKNLCHWVRPPWLILSHSILQGVQLYPMLQVNKPRFQEENQLVQLYEHLNKGPRVPGCDVARTAERSYPTSEARGDGWEELPNAWGQA